MATSRSLAAALLASGAFAARMKASEVAAKKRYRTGRGFSSSGDGVTTQRWNVINAHAALQYNTSSKRMDGVINVHLIAVGIRC